MYLIMGLIMIIFILLITIYTFFYFKKILILFNLNKRLRYFLNIILTLIITFLSVNIWGVSAIVVLHWLFISMLLDLVIYLIKRIKKKDLSNYISLKLIPLLITILILGYAYFNMTNVVETKYNVYTSKNLSQDYKILAITDLHFGTTMDKKDLDKLINKFNANQYDIVLLGGDIVDENTSKKEMIDCFNLLGKIKAKYGIYFIYGNHDTQPYTTRPRFTNNDLINNIQNNNINLLVDEEININEDIILFGRNDLSRNIKRLDTKDIIKKFDQKKFLLVLDHQPLDISYNANLGFDLQISGHTHAGQIFPAETFIKYFINEVAFGHEEKGEYDIIVSSGMGGWAYPLRTSRHSEYVTIILQEKD